MELSFVGSHYSIELRFKFWSLNISPLKDVLYKKGFALSTAGLLPQGSTINSLDAGPIASKGDTTLLYDPEGKRIMALVSNTRDASVSLNELLEALNEAHIMSREVISLISITAEILFSSSVEPIQVLTKVISKPSLEKASAALGIRLSPLSIRFTPSTVASETSPDENYNIQIEPLFTDLKSKFSTVTNYKGKKPDDAAGFLHSLVDKLTHLIKSLES